MNKANFLTANQMSFLETLLAEFYSFNFQRRPKRRVAYVLIYLSALIFAVLSTALLNVSEQWALISCGFLIVIFLISRPFISACRKRKAVWSEQIIINTTVRLIEFCYVA